MCNDRVSAGYSVRHRYNTVPVSADIVTNITTYHIHHITTDYMYNDPVTNKIFHKLL